MLNFLIKAIKNVPNLLKVKKNVPNLLKVIKSDPVEPNRNPKSETLQFFLVFPYLRARFL